MPVVGLAILLLMSLLKLSMLDLTYSMTAALFHLPILIIVGNEILLRWRSMANEVQIDCVPIVDESNPNSDLPIASTVVNNNCLMSFDLI